MTTKTAEMRNQIYSACKELKTPSLYAAYQEQLDNPSYEEMSFDQRLLSLLIAEKQVRFHKRQQRLVKNAHLPHCHMSRLEHIDWDPQRGLNRSLIEQLCDCEWLKSERKPWITISGMTGVGKTFLGSVLAYQACMHGFNSLYYRMSEMISDIEAAGSGKDLVNFRKLLLSKQLLIIDEFGSVPLEPPMVAEFANILDQRMGESSLILIGQMPLKDWHKYIGDPIKADAIMDRITNQSYHIVLKGPSMRSKYAAVKVSKELDDATSQ